MPVGLADAMIVPELFKRASWISKFGSGEAPSAETVIFPFPQSKRKTSLSVFCSMIPATEIVPRDDCGIFCASDVVLA